MEREVQFDRSSRLIVYGRSDWRWLTSCQYDSSGPVLSVWLTTSCLVGVTHHVLSCWRDITSCLVGVNHHVSSCLVSVTRHVLSCHCDSPRSVLSMWLTTLCLVGVTQHVLSCRCDSPRLVLSCLVSVTRHVLSCQCDSPRLVWFWVSPHLRYVSVVLSMCLIHHRYMKAYGGVEGELPSFLTVELDGGEWSVSRFGLFYHLGSSVPYPIE